MDVCAGTPLAETSRNYRPLDKCFDGGKVIPVNGTDPDQKRDDVRRKMQRWGDGARAFVWVAWEKVPATGTGLPRAPGHVFIAEQQGGRTFFWEPQTPDLEQHEPAIETYFARAYDMFIMRVDNLRFNKYAKYRLEDEKGKPLT